MSDNGQRRTALAPIRTDEVYPLPVFLRHAGMTESGWRSAKQNGLAYCNVGKLVFVRGVDFLDWLAANRVVVGAERNAEG